jgi:sortase A
VLAPVALRSRETQRATALRGFLPRTWFDRALRVAEVVFLVAALAVFVRWAYQGPVGNWLHERNLAAVRAQAAAAATSVPASTVTPTLAPVRLPFTVPDAGERSQDDLAASLRRERVLPKVVALAPTAPAPQPASVPPQRLVVPAIGLDTPIRETFVVDGEWEVAQYAAGYMHGTALPGSGNTALAGHAGLYGGVFASLGALSPGDELLLDAGETRFQYRVRELIKVEPTQTEVLNATAAPVLTPAAGGDRRSGGAGPRPKGRITSWRNNPAAPRAAKSRGPGSRSE